MGMVVQHNITAMNSNRMLGQTVGLQAKSTEKLSSGYKINRAADDASGLAISEKMRKQIRGLTQTSANAQDGISAVQTAEGALAEVQDMLQRMNELAVKSANGTNSESDRTAIQNEIDQLTTEIDRVADTTKFNETYLLKGDRYSPKEFSFCYGTMAKTVKAAASFAINEATGLTFKVTFSATKKDNIDAINTLVKALKNQGVRASYTYMLNASEGGYTASGYSLQLNGAAAQNFRVVVTDAKNGNFIIQDMSGNQIATATIGGIKYSDYKDEAVTSAKKTISANMSAVTVTGARSVSAASVYFDKDGNKIAANDLKNYFVGSATAGETKGKSYAKANTPLVYDAVGNRIDLKNSEVLATRDIQGTLKVNLHVGADATSNNQIAMNIQAMSAKGLGVLGLKVDGDNDSNALEAIDSMYER